MPVRIEKSPIFYKIEVPKYIENKCADLGVTAPKVMHLEFFQYGISALRNVDRSVCCCWATNFTSSSEIIDRLSDNLTDQMIVDGMIHLGELHNSMSTYENYVHGTIQRWEMSQQLSIEDLPTGPLFVIENGEDDSRSLKQQWKKYHDDATTSSLFTLIKDKTVQQKFNVQTLLNPYDPEGYVSEQITVAFDSNSSSEDKYLTLIWCNLINDKSDFIGMLTPVDFDHETPLSSWLDKAYKKANRNYYPGW